MTSDKKEKLEQFLNEKLPECAQDWKHFKNLLQNTSLIKKGVISNDWFDDNNQKI